jgi:hypothetical protein
MSYNEDLLPLADQIEVVFKLEITPEIGSLVTKYGKTTLCTKNSKKDFNKLIKVYLKRVLSNLSQKYLENLLDKYFSHDGLVLFISNVLIDLSTVSINNQLDRNRNQQ